MKLSSKKIFFNAHHSPIGAFASFTLGYKGKKGGAGLELEGPADQNVYIGIQTDKSGKKFRALPFFEADTGAENEAERFDIEAMNEENPAECKEISVEPFPDEDIIRDFRVAEDIWQTKDFEFKIISPVTPVPEPNPDADADTKEALKTAIIPAVLVEFTIDNSLYDYERIAFFGFEPNDVHYAARRIDTEKPAKLKGVGSGSHIAIATQNTDDTEAILHFSIGNIIKNINIPENYTFNLGNVGALIMKVPPETKKNLSLCSSFLQGRYCNRRISDKILLYEVL